MNLHDIKAQVREDAKKKFNFEAVFGENSLAEKETLSFLEETIDRTALAVLDMVEGELPDERHSRDGAPEEFLVLDKAWNGCREETLSRLHALREEITKSV